METQGITSIPTFAGTVSLKSTIKRTWPETDELLAWAKQHCPDALKSDIKEGVDKNVLLEYFAKTGQEPPGFLETPVRDLKITRIRTVSP
jgi:hypothetical protein